MPNTYPDSIGYTEVLCPSNCTGYLGIRFCGNVMQFAFVSR